jgi:iron complex outermembrane receptor protein
MIAAKRGKSMKLTHALLSSSVSAAALLIAVPALAQAPASGGAGPKVEEIVVTGTLVRGVAPAGSNVQSLGQTAIQQTGAQNVVQLLSTVPQINNFGQVAQEPLQNGTLGAGRSSVRPNLRGLPSSVVSPVLTMVDGHALVGMGIQQTDADPGMIVPGALDRLELALDGGSSLYGASAVGGVLNFITRTHFNGVEIKADAGAAGSHYRSYDASLTAGRDWNGGGGLVSVNFRINSNLPVTDLKLPRQDLREFGLPDYRLRICSPGNVIVGSQTYAMPNLVAGTVNLCDTALVTDMASPSRQWGAFASISQSLTPDIEFNVKAMGTRRATTVHEAALAESSAVIDPTNPFYRPVPGLSPTTRESLNYGYGPVAGDHTSAPLKNDGFDIWSTLTWHMKNGWRAVAIADYGWTNTHVYSPNLNTTAEAAALTGAGLTKATALNPYDLTQTNPAVIANILNWRVEDEDAQTMVNVRATVDGDVFKLPGGEAKAAFGVQFQRQGQSGYVSVGPVGVHSTDRVVSNVRNVYAAFGELTVPVVGPDNALPFVQSLDLDISARYDYYDRVGGTTNPRLGVTWTVADGYKFRANAATAFTAPDVVDEAAAGSLDAQITVQRTGTDLLPGDNPANANLPSVKLRGALAGYQKPQTARILSVGFDANPPQLRGLTASLTYWKIDMQKVLGLGCPGTTQQQVQNPVAGCNIFRPTLAQLDAFLPTGLPVVGLANSYQGLYAAGTPPYLLLVTLRQNNSLFQTHGLDYSAGYRHTTGWGDVYASLNGTYYMQRRTQAEKTNIWVDGLIGSPAVQAIGTVGVDYGSKFSALARFNYQSSFTTNTLTNQTSIPAWMPIDLFFRYSLDDSMEFTVNVNNLMNILPPLANQSGGQFVSAGINTESTLGRYISLGVKKRF